MYYLLTIVISTTTLADLELEKRVLPLNENCDPRQETCLKGDWLSSSVADCEFDRSFSHPISCTPESDTNLHWVVEPDENGNCRPVNGKPILCGSSGTNTRCVCSSPKLPFNHCRCQYWTEVAAGESENAFCTAYYIDAGSTSLHHYACCDNCDDPNSSCDGQTWHGGSTESYCGTCGTPSGGGVPKYYFNCDDCQTQLTCKNTCNLRSLIATWPGNCWKWVDCFAGCCRDMGNQFHQRRQLDTIEFCGDGICQQSSENPDVCPSDCCYLKNSTCGTNGCTPECCQTATCCSSASFIGGFFLLVLALAWMHMFIN